MENRKRPVFLSALFVATMLSGATRASAAGLGENGAFESGGVRAALRSELKREKMWLGSMVAELEVKLKGGGLSPAEAANLIQQMPYLDLSEAQQKMIGLIVLEERSADFWLDVLDQISFGAQAHLLEALIMAKGRDHAKALEIAWASLDKSPGDPEIRGQVLHLVLAHSDRGLGGSTRLQPLLKQSSNWASGELARLQLALQEPSVDALDDFQDPHYQSFQSTLLLMPRLMKAFGHSPDLDWSVWKRDVVQFFEALQGLDQERMRPAALYIEAAKRSLFASGQLVLSETARTWLEKVATEGSYATRWTIDPVEANLLLARSERKNQKRVFYFREALSIVREQRSSPKAYVWMDRLLTTLLKTSLNVGPEFSKAVIGMVREMMIHPPRTASSVPGIDDSGERAFLFVLQSLAEESVETRTLVAAHPLFAPLVESAFEFRHGHLLVHLMSHLGAFEVVVAKRIRNQLTLLIEDLKRPDGSWLGAELWSGDFKVRRLSELEAFLKLNGLDGDSQTPSAAVQAEALCGQLLQRLKGPRG